MKFTLPSSNKGFTLVELLVVIAVLGVLAAGVLVAINPVEQLARGRDTGRKSAITELGRSLNNYLTANADIPDANISGGFAQALVDSKDIRVAPTNPGTACAVAAADADNGVSNGYCYKKNANNEFVIYARSESESEEMKAGGGVACTGTDVAYIVYSSAAGKTGNVCASTSGPAVGVTSVN